MYLTDASGGDCYSTALVRRVGCGIAQLFWKVAARDFSVDYGLRQRGSDDDDDDSDYQGNVLFGVALGSGSLKYCQVPESTNSFTDPMCEKGEVGFGASIVLPGSNQSVLCGEPLAVICLSRRAYENSEAFIFTDSATTVEGIAAGEECFHTTEVEGLWRRAWRAVHARRVCTTITWCKARSERRSSCGVRWSLHASLVWANSVADF